MSYHKFQTQLNIPTIAEKSVNFEFEVENADDEYESWELATVTQHEGGDDMGGDEAGPDAAYEKAALQDDNF